MRIHLRGYNNINTFSSTVGMYSIVSRYSSMINCVPKTYCDVVDIIYVNTNLNNTLTLM